MNSEKSACRRKPLEKSSSSSSSKKVPEHVDDVDKKNEDGNDSPDLSPNTPTYNVTASCAEDTPNYLVYKKVLLRSKLKDLIMKCRSTKYTSPTLAILNYSQLLFK